MSEAYIVGAVRSPVGRRNGGLSAVHPVDLAAQVLTELIARTGADPSAVDDVIMGCVSQTGPQSIDIARNAWLSAGLPESVPGVTIHDRADIWGLLPDPPRRPTFRFY